MQIISIIHDSFQEFENHCSLVLFSKGCNFACQKCYNLSSMEKEPIGEAIEIIDKYLTPFHDAVVFLGGEPTFWHKDLIETIRYVKNKKLLVKIFTNGSNVETIKSLNKEKLVDAYSVDFKAIKNVKDVIGRNIEDIYYLMTVERTICNILDNNIPIEIRTTKWNTVQDLPELIKYVKNRFPGVTHILQDDFIKHKIKGDSK